jgi:hypothetical protein
MGVSLDQLAETVNSKNAEASICIGPFRNFAENFKDLKVFLVRLKHGLLLASKLFNVFTDLLFGVLSTIIFVKSDSV